MVQDFDLADILSVTTGINLTDDFANIHRLFSFAYGNICVTDHTLLMMKDELTNHIFRIHPVLIGVEYKPTSGVDEWVIEQKAKYGERLPMCPVGETLDETKSTER